MTNENNLFEKKMRMFTLFLNLPTCVRAKKQQQFLKQREHLYIRIHYEQMRKKHCMLHISHCALNTCGNAPLDKKNNVTKVRQT